MQIAQDETVTIGDRRWLLTNLLARGPRPNVRALAAWSCDVAEGVLEHTGPARDVCQRAIDLARSWSRGEPVDSNDLYAAADAAYAADADDALAALAAAAAASAAAAAAASAAAASAAAAAAAYAAAASAAAAAAADADDALADADDALADADADAWKNLIDLANRFT